MSEIKGIDTIQLGTVTGKEIGLPLSVMLDEEITKKHWNSLGIAVIPYCIDCKKPLVWHSPPDGDSTVFHCPKCGRRWVKDDDWIEMELEGRIQDDY